MAAESGRSTSSLKTTLDIAKPEPDNVLLHGSIKCMVSPALNRALDDLVNASITHLPDHKTIIRKESRHNQYVHRLIASGKDLAELSMACRGFEQSSEAADVILGEKLKLKSKASVAYVKQRQSDLIQSKVMTAMMQVAMGLGMKQGQGDAALKDGMSELTALAGEEEALKIHQTFSAWCLAQPTTLPALDSPIAGPLTIKAEIQSLLSSAMTTDPVLASIKNSLHRYNRRSRLSRIAAKTINTSLSIAAFSPTLVSPAAQIAWGAYIMTQGGPEEAKLLKEMYLSQRFASRWQLLYDEATLSVTSYHTALLTNNPKLLAFSQFVMSRLNHSGELAEPAAPMLKTTADRIPDSKAPIVAAR